MIRISNNRQVADTNAYKNFAAEFNFNTEFLKNLSDLISYNGRIIEILNDHATLKAEEEAYKPIPITRQVDSAMINRNYLQIKQDVQYIVTFEIDSMMNDPELTHLVIKR